METNVIRSFAAGLIAAGVISGAVFYAGTSETTSANGKPLEHSEMKSALTSEGYIVMTEEELKNQLVEVETEWQDKLTAAESEWKQKLSELEGAETAKKENSNDTAIYRTIIHVSSGMTSIDVGRSLVQAKVIGNAMDFVREVEKRGLANKLKPGAYEVDSSMNMDKAISIIFK